MKRMIIAACGVLLLAGIATAQTASTALPPLPADQQVNGQDEQVGGRPGSHHFGRHGGKHGGPGMRGGRMEGKGFHIMVGGGHRLDVNCGQELMKDCIAAAQPLVDALGKLDFKPPMPGTTDIKPAQ